MYRCRKIQQIRERWLGSDASAAVDIPSMAAVGRVDDRGTSMMRENGTMQKWHGRPLIIPSTRH
eukprot:7036479-Lingulodinium_polyedra.AAC.1